MILHELPNMVELIGDIVAVFVIYSALAVPLAARFVIG
jgi:hypothetical protein